MFRRTLFHRIFFYFIIIILISLITTTIIIYWQSSKEFDQQMKNHMSQTINNAVHHTNMYLEEYERTVLSLLATEQIQKFVSLPGEDYYDHYRFGSNIKNFHFKNATIRNPEIASVYLISRNGQYVISYNHMEGLGEYDYLFEPEKTHAFLDMHNNKRGELEIYDHSVIAPHATQLMTVSRRIPHPYNVNEYIGVIGVEIHKDELESLWEGIDLGERGYFFVANDRGRIIYDPNLVNTGTFIDAGLNEELQQSTGEMLFDTSGEEERVLLSRPSNYGDWNLVTSMPLEDLRKPIKNIQTSTLIMGGITLIIALLLSVRFVQLIIGPIRTLKKGMVETEQGKWTQLPLTGRRDEMDDLTERYNIMVTRLSELVDRVYKAELKEREVQAERNKAELQALQLQVNPHFLYNTLETIACYAVIEDSDEIADIVKYLSKMFRYAVRTDLEEVTVVNELNHVLNYMHIINYRTGWDFEIDVNIPSKYLLHNTVRLTLQPMVENVFQHAFVDGLEEHHFICIDGFVQNEEFVITIEDNGAGMEASELKKLNQRLSEPDIGTISSEKKGGIGLFNVHRRIQMVFGEEYGLHIESVFGKGTKMYLRMPLKQSEETN